MFGRLRKFQTFVLYLVIGLLYAALLFWLRGLFWSAKYQELRANWFWAIMAVSLVALVVVFYRVSRENENNNEDDS